ncbi:MAG: hypothetical protein WCO93_08625 [bacterium]
MTRRHSFTEMLLFHLLMGIAVAIMSVGSLINFHQYKIWHKPLIPKLVAYKRDHEDLSKVISLEKNIQKDHLVQKINGDTGFALMSESSLSSSHTDYSPVYNAALSAFSARLLPSTGLRAPPTC